MAEPPETSDRKTLRFWLFLALACVGLPVAILLLLTLVWGLIVAPSREEIARIPHPSAPIDAVLVETNGGATTAFGYDVHVVPRDADVEDSDLVAWFYGGVSSRAPRGVHVEWASPIELVIEFSTARQWELVRPTVAVCGRDIRVRVPGRESRIRTQPAWSPPPAADPPRQDPVPHR